MSRVVRSRGAADAAGRGHDRGCSSRRDAAGPGDPEDVQSIRAEGQAGVGAFGGMGDVHSWRSTVYPLMMLLALLPCQIRQPMLGTDRPDEGPNPPVSIPKPEIRRSMLGSFPPAVKPRFVSVPEPEPKTKDPWPRVSVPPIPAWIPRDMAFRAALEIWDEGPRTSFRLELERAEVKKMRWALLADEVEFNRFVESVTRRYRISFKQLVWIARNLCDRDILCDYLGLRVTGRLSTKDGARFPLKTGTARVVDQICRCGLRCSVLSGTSDPDNIRTIDDTHAILSQSHSREQHRRDLNTSEHPFVDPVHTLTKIEILEIIEPRDPRYRNHRRWVRGIVRGRMVFVYAYGLKNTAY
jgi:hypothetical protein